MEAIKKILVLYFFKSKKSRLETLNLVFIILVEQFQKTLFFLLIINFTIKKLELNNESYLSLQSLIFYQFKIHFQNYALIFFLYFIDSLILIFILFQPMKFYEILYVMNLFSLDSQFPKFLNFLNS